MSQLKSVILVGVALAAGLLVGCKQESQVAESEVGAPDANMATDVRSDEDNARVVSKPEVPEPQIPSLEETIEKTQTQLDEGAESLKEVVAAKTEEETETAQKIADSVAESAKMNEQRLVAWIGQQNAEIDTQLMQLKSAIDELPQANREAAREVSQQLQSQRQELTQTIQDVQTAESTSLDTLQQQLEDAYADMKTAVSDAMKKVQGMQADATVPETDAAVTDENPKTPVDEQPQPAETAPEENSSDSK